MEQMCIDKWEVTHPRLGRLCWHYHNGSRFPTWVPDIPGLLGPWIHAMFDTEWEARDTAVQAAQDMCDEDIAEEVTPVLVKLRRQDY